MRRMLLSLAIVITGALAGTNAACAPTLAPIYAPRSNAGLSDSGQPYSPEQIEGAILRGIAVKKWFVIQRGTGFVVAETSAGGHSAQVRILYGPEGWQILHLQSTPGLRHGSDARHGEIIHRRYNHWVNKLNAAIREELSAMRYLPPTPAATAQPATVVVPPPAPMPEPVPAPAPAQPAAPGLAPAPVVPAPVPAPAPAPK